MAKKKYDSSNISMFPEGFEMSLPDGYRIDTEYDDDNNEIFYLRGGFFTNDDGDESYRFTGGFSTVNVEINEIKNEKLKPPFDPGIILDQVSEGLMESFQEQFGQGTRLNLYNSHPASTIMKFYKPVELFGITLNTYIVFYWVEVNENVMFGFNTVYQENESDNTQFFKDLLNVIKSVRVNGDAVDIGKLTPKKLEKALDMEPDENVEALDLGLSVGINFQNGDEESQYTINSDGSITGPDGDVLTADDSDEGSGSIFDLFASQEDVKEVRVSDDDSRIVIVDNQWSFRLPKGVDLHLDTEHTDIMGNNTTSQYVLLGMNKGNRDFFDLELHTRFDFGMGTDLDVLGCRHDNDVMSGNAQQKIIVDGDDLFVDVVNKPIFFSRSMAMVRVRGEDLRPWDFVMGLDGMDEDLKSNWDEVKNCMNELAESIQLIGSGSKSAKKGKKKKEATSSDPDFIISDGVLRKYIGKKSDIVIPEGVKEIADSTFSGFSKLKSVVVPEGVKTIGRRCFENCTSLRNCYLPDSLEELGGYAFVDCHELKEVYLSEKLKTLGDSAFSECFVLKDVKIPKKVKTIDSFTFKNCDAFTHIVIPEGVKSIGFSAFASCDSLEYLFVPKSVTEISVDFMNNHPFSGSEKLTIYTPAGSYAQKFAEENGIPFKNEAKGKVTADNSKAKSDSADAQAKSSKSVTSDEGLAYAAPDESLYPHYNSKQATQNRGFFGMKVVVSQSGTEYKFYQLLEDLSEDASEEIKEAVSKLSDKGAASYRLADRAAEMRQVFHVAPELFDFRNDRECELAEGMMKSAYMMSGLRSFAWTLSKYCDDKKAEPGKLSLEQIQSIADFVADRDWLNYDGESYCKALCGTPDLHVYYIPDNTAKSVRKAFEPSAKELEDTRKMQEQIPTFSPIFSQSGSLDGLRKDLEYISPAIEKIYEDIREKRDYNEPLEGSDADILYAWCALAYAARGPFFSEDGPMGCFFSQIETEEEKQKKEEERRQEEIKQRAEMSKEYLDSYGKYFEKNPKIVFADKKFVFSGMGSRIYVLGDDTDYTKLIEDRGGLTRKNVSGVTDYLVVDPAGAGESKISKAIENQQNGKPTKIILMEDLRKALGLPSDDAAPAEKTTEKPAAKEEPAPAAKTAASTSKPSSGSSSRKTKAAKPAAGGKTVTVDNTWTVTIPEGYKYSTDKNKIGGHRNIIFMEDKAGNTFDWPFDATISFTSQFNDSQGAPAPAMAKMMAGIFGNNINVIRDDDDLYVGTYLFSQSTGDGDADVYKIDIGCGTGTSSVQVFFNRKLPVREEKKLVDTVAKSVRLVSEEAAFTPSSSSPLSAEQQKQKAELDRQIEDLRSQAAFYSAQDLSAEDKETLKEINKGLSDLGRQMEDMSASQDKLAEHIRQREEKERKREEEKERKKKEILASGNTDDVIVDMYVIMNNEKNYGKTKRAQDKFYELYNEDFPTLDKKGLIGMRKYVLEKMKDPEQCKEFDKMFMQRSVEDRFKVSTANYFNVSYSNITGRIEEAIDKTSQWYTREEFVEVRRLMDAHIGDMRTQLDEQMDTIEAKWKQFPTARDSLTIYIKDSYASDAVKEDKSEMFQMEANGKLVEIALYTKGVLQLGFTLLNAFSWYWDKEVAEIWSAALIKNQIEDKCIYNEDPKGTARSAFEEIKKKYPLETDTLRRKTNDFILKLKALYDDPKTADETKKEIKQLLKESFSNKAEFSKCRRFFAVSGNVKDVPALDAMLEEGIPAGWIYDEIADAAAKEIGEAKERKDNEEAALKYEESVKLMEEGGLLNLIKAEEKLASVGSYKDAKQLLKQCTEKLDEVRPGRYAEALDLMQDPEANEKDIIRAIDTMDELGSYKDAADKADEYRKILDLERKYETARKLLEREDLAAYIRAQEILEGLDGYKDSEKQNGICSKKIEGIKAKEYEKALLLEKEETEESLTEAKAKLIAIKPYKDAEDRIKDIDQLSVILGKYNIAEEKARNFGLQNWKEAENLFRSIEDYRDAGERADECHERIMSLCEEKIESAQKAEAVLSVKSQNQAIGYYREIAEWYEVDENIAACEENISEIKESIRLNHVLEECRAELAKTKGRKWKKPIKTLIDENEKQFNNLKQRLSEVAGSSEITISESGISESELETLKAPSPELEEIRKTNEKGRKNAKWRNLIIIAFLIVLGVGIASVIIEESKPDLSEYEDVTVNSVHSMSYEIPRDWKVDANISDIKCKYYTLEKNNKIVAITKVEYKGDRDLVGDAGYNQSTDNHNILEKVTRIIPDAEGLFDMVEADESAFEVAVYYSPDSIKGESEYLTALCESFNTDKYQNPRVLQSVNVKYTGDTEEGTVVGSNKYNIAVEAQYDTQCGIGRKSVEWTLKEPVTLKAGETSKLTIIFDGKEYSTDITCTTKPEDSKDNKDGEDSEEASDDEAGESSEESTGGVSGRLPSRDGASESASSSSYQKKY